MKSWNIKDTKTYIKGCSLKFLNFTSIDKFLTINIQHLPKLAQYFNILNLWNRMILHIFSKSNSRCDILK